MPPPPPPPPGSTCPAWSRLMALGQTAQDGRERGRGGFISRAPSVSLPGVVLEARRPTEHPNVSAVLAPSPRAAAARPLLARKAHGSPRSAHCQCTRRPCPPPMPPTRAPDPGLKQQKGVVSLLWGPQEVKVPAGGFSCAGRGLCSRSPPPPAPPQESVSRSPPYQEPVRLD